MNAELELLVNVHRVDQVIHHLREALATQRGAVANAESVEGERQRERDEAHQRFEAERKNERQLQRKIEEYQHRHEAALRMLEMGAGTPEAAERQMEQCTAILDTTETELLFSMEAVETLENELQISETKVRESQYVREQAEVEAPGEVSSLELEEAKSIDERGQYWNRLDPELQKRYQILVRSKKKYAVSTVEGKICTSCRISISPQQMSNLRRGHLESCRQCGRWLYDAH